MADGQDSLEGYNGKRDFSRTPEPRGEVKGNGAGIFVVQMHAARALHYDFRLELHGVLKSWAVPKGPSVNPDDKRLAVHVEDHPVEYARFEGIIPKGEYGGGTVLLWDKGFWVPEEDPDEGMRKGALKFILSGRKLKGRWALVKLKEIREEGKDEWLLIKERDEESAERDIVSEMPGSVASGRSIDEVSTLPEGIWNAAGEAASILPSGSRAGRSRMPEAFRPQLAALVDSPPEGEQWLHEIKYDGYRVLAKIKNGAVELYTRNGNDWTYRFPRIKNALAKIPVSEAWLDGEVVFLKENGTTSFEGLQNAVAEGNDKGLVYIVFDMVYYCGYSLFDTPLSERKALASAVITPVTGSGIVRFSKHVEGRGQAFFDNACVYGIEGIISKRKDSRYSHGRTRSWVKVKCHERQEFVIGGYTEPGAARKGFGALLIGVYDPQKKFIYSGRVGTGFSERSIMEIWERLRKIEEPSPAFYNPPTGPEAKGVHWVKPELVAEVEYAHWTKEGVLRHPSFQGLREDKPPDEIVHEDTSKLKEAIGPAEEGLVKEDMAEAEAGPVKEIRKVKVTNPGRVFFPEDGITKQDLIDYYELAAPLMLPHLAGRPLTLVRCPEGYDKECFFQKHAVMNIPSGIKRLNITENDGTPAEYLMVDSPEGIIGLVQLGTLEIHTWNSRYIKLEYPDRAVFDIDPDPSVGPEALVESVYLLKSLLEELGLKSFVKTTGGKGFHVAVPLLPEKNWEEVKAFTKGVADFLSKGLPGRFTSMMTKSRRTGKIFIDYMRNIRGATAIEAYSVRAKKGAPVAAAVSWDELPGIRSDSFAITNMRNRIQMAGNPWAGFFDIKQRITDEMKRKLGMS